MENSNNWINEAFKSVQHYKQPTLNADLFSKIEQRINKVEAKIILIPIWKVAIAAVVVIIFNLFTFQNLIATNQTSQSNDYQLGTNYNFYISE